MWQTPSIILTPWSRVLLEKLTGFHLVKRFSAFYGTRRFVTTFTSSRHLSISWASSIQSIPPHPTSCRFILILSTQLGLVSQVVSFPQVFPPKPLYMSPPPICATCPAHLILLDFITRNILGDEYRSLSASLCSFLHSLVTSSLLGPNFVIGPTVDNSVSSVYQRS